ncbi:aminoacyl-tRNA hydrolase [Candidatus Pelagibacter sp.]|jgi:PTH1 family peptidyl-tRNA hydrolase|nr:aminoacyl-tRNA hydrolase [Candidatus Pelagibacter sp.]|tara:strand:+ start:15 stop:575 length:561 start_codon:yes stop_codon:yes gene_type:complete
MILLVGLGNPTPDSNDNRHNIGFKIIDAINQKFALSKQKPKFKGLLTTGIISNKKVYAIKPLTFMNNSGICIRELIEYFKINAEDVIVFHDDLDIDFTKIKAKFGGSSAGHNGIASIDKFIGKEYSRVRVGIGKPDSKIDVSDFVLTNFSDEEKVKLEKVIQNIIESMPILIDKKLDLFSSTVNNQ